MENELSGAAIQELAQRLYKEVQTGTPAPEAIAKVWKTVEGQRVQTAEHLRLLVTGAAIQAYRNQQPELEDALLHSLGEENWDVRTYEFRVMKIMRQGKVLEAWKLLKKCERKFGHELSTRSKFETCKRVAELPNSKELLEAMLQEDSDDEVVKTFQLLNRAAELKAKNKKDKANNLVSQITITDSSVHLRLGREMIKRGFASQGAKIAKTATDENRATFVTVSKELLDAGHAREAAEVIEPVIHLGIVRSGTTSGIGINMDALNQFAKCARADADVRRKFEEEMERLRQTGELPPEYWHRVMLVFQTGRAVRPSTGRYQQTAKSLGIKVSGETKKKLRDTPIDVGQVEPNALPELDESGETKKRFQTLLEQGALAQAAACLSPFRGKVPFHIIGLYDKRIRSALSAGTHSLEEWNGVLDADPESKEILTLALKSLLVSNKIDTAMALFTQRHGGNLQNGRMFGQLLFDTGRRGNSLPSRAALIVLEAGHPKVAIEVIKPILLNYIASKHEIPPHVLEAFAKCAAIDVEIRRDFFDQLRDYRKHRRLSEPYVDTLLATVYSQEDELLQEKVGRANRMTQPNGSEEDEEQYIGRVSRSKFFQDPHAMLRSQPVDKTASLVTGRRRIPRKCGRHQ